MTSSAKRKLLSIQKKIHRSLSAEAERLTGGTPESLRAYEREFQSDFRGAKARALSKEGLIEAIRATDVSFIADFHAFEQAQRTALRLIRDAIAPDEKWWIGLEMIPSHHQRDLDEFQAGRLTLEEFHERIRYEEVWGFPWSGYAPLFTWARAHGIRLVALNCPLGADLHERDRWAAGIITDFFSGSRNERRKTPPPRMIVLYGEMHVGHKHLPTALARVSKDFLGRALGSISIHQNHDELYWALAREGKESSTEALRLRKDTYCVISSTPWNKLHSLISWIEGESESAEEDDFDEELSIDYLSLMRTYGSTLSELLGARAPSFDGLTLKTVEDADFIESLPEGGFTQEEKALLRHEVLHHQRLFIPRFDLAYLAHPSQNGAAELTAIFLLKSHSSSAAFFQRKREDFFRLSLEWAFGFLGSLLLNPRRKCDLLLDHQKRLEEIRRGARPSFRHEALAREITVQALQSIRSGEKVGAPLPLLKASLSQAKFNPATHMASRYLGRVVGKCLHSALLSDAIELDELFKIFCSKPVPRAVFSKTLHERRFFNILERIPLKSLDASKHDRL